VALDRQRPTQLRDVALQDLHGGVGWPLPPQLVDQPVGRQHFVRVKQKQCEQCTLPPPPEWEPATVVPDLERAEDSELQVYLLASDDSPPRTYRRATAAYRPLGRPNDAGSTTGRLKPGHP
jgi:hypothetical protein